LLPSTPLLNTTYAMLMGWFDASRTTLTLSRGPKGSKICRSSLSPRPCGYVQQEEGIVEQDLMRRFGKQGCVRRRREGNV
jgi:hypothetical protein